MLRNISAKTYFLLAYLLVCSTQIYATFNHQLFGDEAFYWLEGQWLAWSYSEVPGWTPWTLAFVDWLLPHHQFFIRIPSLLAAFSIPWLGILIARSLTDNQVNHWLAGLLLLALPILGVAGTLAIPDVWLVFFTLLAVRYLIQAVHSQRSQDFIVLGLILALGINVHLRFWLVTLVTGLVVFWQFKADKPLILKLLKLTLPMMLLGFVPVLLFNLQHDFPLLTFQLKDRHPWQFQASHFNFFLIQIVITTPWVFYLCVKNLTPKVMIKTDPNNQQALIKTLIYTALVHWLVYAIVGFFSDTLRLNVHWTLVSYVLLLLITAVNSDISPRLKRWAVVTGITANLWLLMTISYWLLESTPQSEISSRITTHANGWQQLAVHTNELLIRENQPNLLTDHFMTLAQLKFYAKQVKQIKSLPHPLNIKHGRDKQLEIMGIMQGKSVEPQILVVEHSALKLTEMIDFYQSSCELLNGLELIDSVDISHGLKRYHYFKTGANNGACEIPPIVYYEYANNTLSGWVLQQKNKSIKLSIYDAEQQTELNSDIQLSIGSIGTDSLFANLNTNQYQLLEFKLNDPGLNDKTTLQFKITSALQTIYSQRLVLSQ